jgi:hypothetical protein
MSERRTFEALKYAFKPDELRELGEALARETGNVGTLEDQKKAATAELSAQIKQARRRCDELAEKINNGYELREVECMSMLETPRPGMKRVIRLDTNETVRDEPMTSAEMQSSFGFREDDDPPPPDGKSRGAGK